MNLRPVQAGDVCGILSLIGGVYAEYDLVLRAELEEPHLLDPLAYFRDAGGEFWVVEDSGRIVATAAVWLHADAGELKTLYVHPALRGQGWGRRLTNLVIEFARGAGRPRLFLWSDTRFLVAHRLYRSMGFAQGGTRLLNDSNNSTEYEFTLELAADPSSQSR